MDVIVNNFYAALMKLLERQRVALDGRTFYVEKDSDSEAWGFHAVDDKTRSFNFVLRIQPTTGLFSGFVPDFALFMNGMSSGYVVEIGEYKEPNKQNCIDKGRRRAYLSNGFIPVAFTGYEAYHNADECVWELLDIVARTNHFFDFHSLGSLMNMYYDKYREEAEKVKKLTSKDGSKQAFRIKKGKVLLAKNSNA